MKEIAEIVREAFEEIKKLKPTREEIREYARYVKKQGRLVGVVLENTNRSFCKLEPEEKITGYVHYQKGVVPTIEPPHIDLGYEDVVRLYLDRAAARDFIKFLKERRGLKDNK